jgi:predicted Zn-dependent protease
MKITAIPFAALMLFVAGCANMPDLKNLPGGAGSMVGLIPGASKIAPHADNLVSGAKAVSEATREITEEEEIDLGQQLMGVILGAAPLHNNDRIQRYVNQVGRWVASHSERPNLPWRFAVLESPLVNAGAAPGGQIYITTGLLFRMRSEAELAGALAHEIAHVVQKHHIKAYQKGQGSQALISGLNILVDSKVKTGGLAGEVGKQTLKIGLDAAKKMILLSLDRGEEEQADRMGMVLAARAGYDPFGLPSAIQILQSVIGDQGSTSVLFSTHPTPEARLASLDKSMSNGMERYSGQANLQDRFISTILGMPIPAGAPAPTAKTPTKSPAKAPPKK